MTLFMSYNRDTDCAAMVTSGLDSVTVVVELAGDVRKVEDFGRTGCLNSLVVIINSNVSPTVSKELPPSVFNPIIHATFHIWTFYRGGQVKDPPTRCHLGFWFFALEMPSSLTEFSLTGSDGNMVGLVDRSRVLSVKTLVCLRSTGLRGLLKN